MLTIRQNLFLSTLSAISFGIAFVVGGSINKFTGVPLTGGIANGIIVGALMTIGVKSVNRFGSGTLIWLLFSTFALQTNTLGPPHLSKILIGLSVGLLWDTIIHLFHRRNIGIVLGSMVGSAFIVFSIYFQNIILQIELSGNFQKWMLPLILINISLGCTSSLLGIFIYDKHLKTTPLAMSLVSRQDE